MLDDPIDSRDDAGGGALTETIEHPNGHQSCRPSESVGGTGHRSGHVSTVSVAILAGATRGDNIVARKKSTHEVRVTRIDSSVDDVRRDPLPPPRIDDERRVEWKRPLIDTIETP